MLTLDNPHAMREIDAEDIPDLRWTANLSYDESFALVDYTQTGYRGVNAALNGFATLNGEHKETVQKLDTALGKAPKMTEKRPLYRVQRLNTDLPVIGQDHTFKGFASTSRNPGLISNYLTGTGQEVMFEIFTNKGVDINSFSVKEGHEREVLLPRNTSFHVHNVVKTDWVILLRDEESGLEYDYCYQRDITVVQLTDY